MRFLRSNTAVIITVGPFYDATDGVTIETALTITNERITLTADTDAGSAPTNILDNVTGATSGTSNDLNYITGNDAGMMQLELAAADVNRVGRMFLSITDAANHVPVFHEFFVLPQAIYDWFTGVIVPLPANVTQLLGTAWLAPGTAGTPDVNAKQFGAAPVTATTSVTFPAASTVATTTGAVGSVTGAVGSVTGAVGSVTGAVGSVTGAVGSVTGLTPATVHADLDDIQARLPAALTANGNMKSSLVEILTTALTETAGLLAGGFKKLFNVAAPTGTLNSIPDAVAGAASGLAIVGSDVGVATSVSGAVGSVTGNVGGNVTGSVGSVVGLTAATVHSDLDDIQARLPAVLVSGRMDSSVGAMAANVVTAAAVATGAIDADALATDAVNEIVDQVWDELAADHNTAGTMGNKLNSAGGAADPWGVAVPGAYLAGTAGSRLGRVPDIAAGAAGGLFIAGTNAPVTITGSGHALTLTSTGGNGTGLNASGNGSGAGLKATGGATGIGIHALGGATSGQGIKAIAVNGDATIFEGGMDGIGLSLVGKGEGAGLNAQGGATGDGAKCIGGTTSGNGLYAYATLLGHGISAVGVGSAKAGVSATGGTNAAGVIATGAGSGSGLLAKGGATGDGINAEAGGTSGSGIFAYGLASGAGITAQGNGSQAGIWASGGAGQGAGVLISGGDATTLAGLLISGGGASNSHGIMSIGLGTGSGLHLTGGATGHGLKAVGGATSGDGANFSGGGAGDGIEAVGTGGEVDIDADIVGAFTGTITGDVSGKVLGGGAGVITGTGVRAVDGSGNAIAPASATTTIQADTDDIQARLPASLTVNGNMKSSLMEILATALTETAGLLAGAFKKFFNVASPTGTANSLPDAVPGAAGGLLIDDVWTDVRAAKLDNLDATISSRGTGTALTQADVRTAVGLASANLDTQLAALEAALPEVIKKNTALNAFEFLLVLAADHATPATGLVPTATRSIDGGAFGATTNSPTEVGSGIYKINLSAGDLNGNVVTLKFSAGTADDRFVTVITNS